MSAVDFPTVGGSNLIQKMNIKLVNSVAVNTSPYSFAQQVQNFGGARWEANVTLRPMVRSEALVFQAFLASLRGSTIAFRMGNPLSVMTSAPTASVNTVQSANQTTLGLTLSGGSNLSAGQEIQIENNLYMVLGDVITNGDRTVAVAPPLRKQYADNVAITVNEPKGIWRMKKPEVDWDIDRNSIYSFSFSCCEAV